MKRDKQAGYALAIALVLAFVMPRIATAAENLPNPHQGSLVNLSSEYGDFSLELGGVFGFIHDRAKEPGGNEADYGDSYLNPQLDFTRKVDSGQIGISWNFIVPESILLNAGPGNNNGGNRIRIKGYLSRPMHLIKGYYQKHYGNSLLEVTLGQDLFAGFQPLVNVTEYFAFSPPLFIHSWQYDQGIALGWTGLTKKGVQVWKVRGGVINGDYGFGMIETQTREFHNSYPGYTLTGELELLRALGANEDFIKSVGDFKLEFSVVEDDRGSNPFAKKFANQRLAGLRWSRDIWGYDFQLRGSSSGTPRS